MLARVIVAVEGAALRKKLKGLFTNPDIIVKTATKRDLLWERIAKENADLIVADQGIIPKPVAETIRVLRNLPDSPDVVVVSGRDALIEQAEFLAAGCRAVLNPDLPPKKIADVLLAVLAERRDQAPRGILAEQTLAEPRLSDFVSDSPTMRAFMKTVRRIVASDSSLLILGETGVGKERLALAIHAEGPRSEGPFVPVNCGALPETLLESELFGHEEGAFTGASRDRRGMFELAHTGTVFLDEIGELPLHLQVKLLRVLQERRIQRLGSEKAIAVDVRVVAASNRDLEAEVEANRFRRDVFYRLSVVTLTIPPLRDRREDIPALVKNYIEYLRPQVGREVTGITDDALNALDRYAWPGNVRELINVIERAMLLCDDDRITIEDLPQAIGGRGARPFVVLAEGGHNPGTHVPESWLQKPIREGRARVVADFEREYLAGLLHLTGGRVGETAKRAGIEARSLYDKMKKYDLRKEDFKHRE